MRPLEERLGKNRSNDMTIKIRELIGFGRLSGTIGENELALLERIIDKYMNPEVTGRPGQSWWSNSTLSGKLLNIMNYELVEYEFVEIIYFLMIKKLSSHKETEDNKRKYQEHIDLMAGSVEKRNEQMNERKEFGKETRYLKSKKSGAKKKMEEKRKEMEK